jgi:hypothetical protein
MEHKNFLKFSGGTLVIMGFILLLGPDRWFPNFYSPVFMGIIALLSPFLIYLPKFFLKKSTLRKRNLILKMRSVIAFSLLVNFTGELGLFQLYKYGFEYDKFAHVVVSMAFAFVLGESLREWEQLHSRKLILIVFLIVFSSGMLWEIFEASSDYLFKTQEWGVYGNHLALDTYKDIGFNTLGALAGIIVFKIPKGRNKRGAGKIGRLPLPKSKITPDGGFYFTELASTTASQLTYDTFNKPTILKSSFHLYILEGSF